MPARRSRCFPPPYAPEALIEYVARVRGTAIFLVPTILRRLLELELAGLAFPTMQKLVASGSALYGEERAAIKRRLTPNLYEMYSSTEGGGVSVLGPDDGDLHPDSVGRPCFRVEVEIVDNDHNPLPAARPAGCATAARRPRGRTIRATRRKRFATAGTIRAISPRSVPTASSSSRVARRT